MQKFPAAQIILLTPLQSIAFTNARREAVAEIIVGCANQLGCMSIRQDRECGIYREQESVSYYRTTDGTNPSKIGAITVGNALFRLIKTFVTGS